jgi:hypothetical protein
MVGFSGPAVRPLPPARENRRREDTSRWRRAWRWMRATGQGEAMARKAWMKREQWFVWIAAAVVVTMVVAAAIGGYVGRWWDFL